MVEVKGQKNMSTGKKSNFNFFPSEGLQRLLSIASNQSMYSCARFDDDC